MLKLHQRFIPVQFRSDKKRWSKPAYPTSGFRFYRKSGGFEQQHDINGTSSWDQADTKITKRVTNTTPATQSLNPPQDPFISPVSAPCVVRPTPSAFAVPGSNPQREFTSSPYLPESTTPHSFRAPSASPQGPLQIPTARRISRDVNTESVRLLRDMARTSRAQEAADPSMLSVSGAMNGGKSQNASVILSLDPNQLSPQESHDVRHY